jgi:hypothetical protein
MVTKKNHIVFLILLSGFPAVSQDWVFKEIKKLPVTINTDAEESMPLLTPDGKTLFFTRFMDDKNVGGKYSGQDIWFSRFDGRGWSKADNSIETLNNDKNNNAVVGISADGKVIYLLNGSPNHKLKGLYFSKSINGTWSDPELIPIEGIDNDGFVGFYVSPDFDVILISMKGPDSKGEEDLYICLKNQAGQWSKPKNLGSAINTPGYEISPFLTTDKKRLYFSSNGHEGLGSADIFYSERLYNSWDIWSAPKNLGKEINSSSFDAYFSIYNDSIALLTSNRSDKNAEIYRYKIANEKSTDQESIDKIVAEANTILTDLNKSDEDRKIIIFDEGSTNLAENDKSELLELARKITSSNRFYTLHIQAYYNSEAEKNDESSVFQKRINEIQKYMVLSGVKTSIEVSMQEARSNVSSSRYITVVVSPK